MRIHPISELETIKECLAEFKPDDNYHYQFVLDDTIDLLRVMRDQIIECERYISYGGSYDERIDLHDRVDQLIYDTKPLETEG